MKKRENIGLVGRKMGKIERMFVIKNLSNCPLSIKKLVKGLIEEIAKLYTRNFRLLEKKEYFRKRSLVCRKELLKQCYLKRKLQEQLNKKKVKESTISLPN